MLRLLFCRRSRSSATTAGGLRDAERAILRKMVGAGIQMFIFLMITLAHPAHYHSCKADGVSNTKITLRVDSYDAEAWLSQANYIFSRLQITSNLEDYLLIESIYFTITIRSVGEDPPHGYLSLCPKEDFETSPSSYRWPNRPVYWSLDPEGIKVLSTEEAAWLGFPSFQLTTEVRGKSWDPSVYTGLRTFHQAKGFNPDSQEVALHLGKRLFRLSRDVNSPFAQGQADEMSRNGGPDGGRSLDQYAPTDDTGVLLKESPLVSRGFQFIMMVQLMLIFLLSLFSLYEQAF
ncbi:hypothetical protein B0H16DRAFT_1632916 [Mycena metata]|uniref:Uncharacterized protein n=1 Tax=Mycena metata TaxID=1033252 RepID=A0AAD7GYI7_9AGAR|nr:hypothetical protein B0H16DRAFT_1632916 [Mycena metata]